MDIRQDAIDAVGEPGALIALTHRYCSPWRVVLCFGL